MRDRTEQGNTPGDESLDARIDATCDAFEEAWRSNPPAQIGDFLNGWEEPERRELFRELVRTDLELRRGKDQPTFSIREHYDRFPEYCAEIDTALREASDTSRDTDRAATHRHRSPRIEFKAGDQIGDYDVVSPIGKGAFAVVYLAYEREFNRHVALKVSNRGGDEPPTLGQLNNHPNIVNVYRVTRFESDEGQLIGLGMEYVDGGTLQAVISKLERGSTFPASGEFLLDAIDEALGEERERRADSSRDTLRELSWGQVVCHLGAQLADALAYAHSKGVFHRDIKPANVLLKDEGTPKLVDFNIAYGSHVSKNAADYFGGTLAYMSPEQLEACDPQSDTRPEDLDHRSDIYSLAVVLWELLTGRHPFRECVQDLQPSKAAEERRRGVAIDAISNLPTTTPVGLHEVLGKCLEPDPKYRYHAASEVARDLRLCTIPRIQTLLRPSDSPVLRWVNRHPLLTTVLISLLPNVVLSVANVLYDLHTLVKPLELVQPGAKEHFWQVILWGKAILYSGGVLFGVWQAVHVFVAMHRGSSNTAVGAARRGCLKLGDLVFAITLTTWVASGFFFPYFMEALRTDLKLQHYFLFFTAHLLCGLISANLVVFTLTFLEVRLFYPRLLFGDLEARQLRTAHSKLRKRLEMYFTLAIAVPFISALAPGLSGLSSNETSYWQAFLLLGVVGAVVYFLASASKAETNKDLDALDTYVDLLTKHGG